MCCFYLVLVDYADCVCGGAYGGVIGDHRCAIFTFWSFFGSVGRY